MPTPAQTLLLQPSFMPAMLTLSGNEITDALRALAIQGDGLLNDSSMGNWPPATNLCTNGGFETNTTGWTTGGTNTLAVDTGQFKFGAKSGKATYSNNATLADYAAIITNVAHAVSCWVYIPTAYDGQGIEMRQLNYTVAASAVNANMGLRDQWQRVTLTFTPGADVTGNIQVNNTGTAPTATRFIYIDGVQIETGSVATPYIETDGGTAARSAGRVRIPSTVLSPIQGWAAVRIRASTASSGLPWTAAGDAVPHFLDWYIDTNNRLQLLYYSGGFKVESVNGGAGANANSATAVAAGDILTVVWAWTATTLYVSVNGAAFTSAARTGGPFSGATTTIDVMSFVGADGWPDCDLFWLATGRGILSNTDAAIINGFGTTDPDPRRFPGQCTGFWDCKTGTFQRRR